MRRLLSITGLHVFLICTLAFLVYSNTFYVPFHFDDHSYIQNNPLIENFSFYTAPSEAATIEKRLPRISFQHRFVTFLTFAMNYTLHGRNVFGYHAFNLGVHVLTSLIVYILVLLTFRTPLLRNSRIAPVSRQIALFSALLFAVHPVQTEAVTYLSQRFASLATLFYLLSLISYIASRLSVVSSKRYTFYAFAVFFAIIAMKSKEIAFTIPLTIVLYEFMFMDGAARRRIARLVPFLLTLSLIPLSFIDFHRPLEEALDEATRTQHVISHHDYFLTQMRVILTYFRLLLFPTNQNLDYDYPLFTSFLSAGVLLSGTILLSILVAAFLLHRRGKASEPACALISFGLFWFFVSLSVESSFVSLADVIFEHRLYLPSAGFFISIVTAAFVAKDRLNESHAKKTFAASIVIVLISFASLTYARNDLWTTHVGMWKDVVNKSPLKARARHNLGMAYAEKGMTEKAMEQYEIALAIDPRYERAHINLARACASIGRIDDAIKHYAAAIHLNPEDFFTQNAIGLAYAAKGHQEKAIPHYLDAIRLKPDYADAYNDLALAYEEMGNLDKAVDNYKKCIEINPRHADAYNNLALVYLDKGLYDMAIDNLQHSIQLKPQRPGTYVNLGDAYLQKGFLERAVALYNKALELQPNHPGARYGLSMLAAYDRQ